MYLRLFQVLFDSKRVLWRAYLLNFIFLCSNLICSFLLNRSLLCSDSIRFRFDNSSLLSGNPILLSFDFRRFFCSNPIVCTRLSSRDIETATSSGLAIIAS